MNSGRTTQNRKLRWLYLFIAIVALIVAAASFLLSNARVLTLTERLVSNATNRDFQVRGSFEYELGTQIVIRATDIVWRNAEWSSNPEMLAIDQFIAVIDASSIVSPPIRIISAEVRGGDIRLEWQEGQDMNWAFDLPEPPEGTPETPPRESLPLLLETAAISDFGVHFIHPTLTDELTIAVETANHVADSDDNLVVAANLKSNNRTFKLQTTVGPFPNLVVAGSTGIDIQLEGEGGTLLLQSHFDSLRELRKPQVKLQIQAKDSSQMARDLQLPVKTVGEIDVTAELNTKNDKLLLNVDGKIGQATFSGTADADNLTTLEGFDLKFEAAGASARNVGLITGIEGLPDAPYTFLVDSSRVQQGLEIRALSLETAGISVDAEGMVHKVPEFKDFDLTVKASADNLATLGQMVLVDNLPPVPFKLDAVIAGSSESSTDKLNGNGKVGNASISVTGDLTEADGFEGSSFNISISSPNPMPLLSHYNVPVSRTVPLAVSGGLQVINSGIEFENVWAEIDGQPLRLHGRLGLAPDQPLLRIDIEGQGSDLNRLASILELGGGTPKLTKIDYDLDGTLTLNGDQLSVKTRRLQLNDTKIGFDGDIGLGKELTVAADISAESPDISTTLALLNIDSDEHLPFSVASRLSINAQQTVLSNLTLNIANSKTTGKVASGWPGNPDYLELDISSSGDSLRNSIPFESRYEPPDLPFTIRTKGAFGSSGYDIDILRGSIGRAKITAAGKIGFEPRLNADNLRIKIDSPATSELGSLKGWQAADEPISVTVTLDGTEDEVRLDDFSLVWGPSDLQGTLVVDTRGKPEVTAKFTSQLLDFEPLRRELDSEPDGQSPEQVEKLLSDEPFARDWLQKANGSVDINVASARTSVREIRNIQVVGKLRDGMLTLDNINASSQLGIIDASLTVDATGDIITAGGEYEVQNLTLTDRVVTKEERELLPQMHVSGNLTGSGNSAAELAAALNGYTWIVISPGVTEAAGLQILYGDFVTQLAELVNPFSEESKQTTINCGGVYLEAIDGIVETAPAIIVQTDKVSITAKGSVDLRKEKINVVFNTSPRSGVGLSAGDIVNPFIKLGGTLQKPSLVLNPTEAAIKGTAAVATVGLSVVGTSLWNRWIRSPNACERIAEKATEIRENLGPNGVIPKWLTELVD